MNEFNPSMRSCRWPGLRVLACALLWLPACRHSEQARYSLPGVVKPAAADELQTQTAATATAPPDNETTKPEGKPKPAGTGEVSQSAQPPAADDHASLICYGTTEPHQRSTLTPTISGIVSEILVQEGQFVKKGDTLVKFDTADFELRYRSADASLKMAKVQTDGTLVEWNRAKALVDDTALPKGQFDLIDARLKGARAGIEQAQVGVAMARKALQDTVVYAPYDAVVTARHVSKGEYAAMMPPKPLVTIEDIETLDLRIQVPATQMPNVRVGDRFAVHFPAVAKDMEIVVARLVPSLNPMTRSFSVILEIPNADHALRPGMFAEARPLGGTAPANGAEGQR